MIICWNKNIKCLNFACEKLCKSITTEKVFKGSLNEIPLGNDTFFIKVDFLNKGNFMTRKSNFKYKYVENKEEKYDIKVHENSIEVYGYSQIGAMYGVLDLAETIKYFGMENVKDKSHKAELKNRGVKFNIPIEPYDDGDAFQKNMKTFLSKEFWKDYIEMLATNRYNLLSLWTNNCFHYMFRLEKYPEACPFSDVELSKFQDLFTFIFSYARELGIKTYIITWNIRITKFIAKSLGLPEQLGDQSERCSVVYDMFHGINNISENFDIVRQNQDLIKDYFAESIKTLLLTYPDLYGLGTSYSEEMKDSAAIRAKWVEDVYLKGILMSGRYVPFIIRTNSGSIEVSKKLLDSIPNEENYLSLKYSIAHMYSHSRPKFWDIKDDIGVETIYTVRNDDIFTFRWGNYDYVQDYIKGMIENPVCSGYYWGADGYMWGIDFQHSDTCHKSWKYDFEKHWHEFELLGRLGYDNNVSKELFKRKYIDYYGNYGNILHDAIECVSNIVPAINRLIWYQFDFEWQPESLLSVWGFRSILDIMESVSMPNIGTISIQDYANCNKENLDENLETPIDIINIIKSNIEKAKLLIADINRDKIHAQTECALWDIDAWIALGNYYICKINACIKLCEYKKSGEKSTKNEAVQELETAVSYWENLTLIWSRHYIPHFLARVKMTFDYGLYYNDVKRDILIAKNI